MLDNTATIPISGRTRQDFGISQRSCASITPQWHCVFTLPSKEAAADRAMQRAGFETYFPQFQMVWRDRQKFIRPLFPRYTFVRFDAATDPYKLVIRDSMGQEVGKLMVEPTTRKPYTISDAIVETLLAQAGPDGVIYPPQPRQLQRGDTGRVKDGALEAFTGICSRTSRDRVWLLLEIMGRRSEVQFDRDAVEIV